MSTLEKLLNDPRHQSAIYAQTRELLKRMKLPRSLGTFAGIYRCSQEEALDIAASELWEQLLKKPQEAEQRLLQLQLDAQSGRISPSDIWFRLVRDKGCWPLIRYLQDKQRREMEAKANYKRLRESLTKSGRFRRDAAGKAYAPQDIAPDSPIAPDDDSGDFSDLPALPRVDDAQKLLTQAVLSPLATDFWHAYIARRCQGRPHFIPFYTLFCWLTAQYELGNLQRVEDADDDDGDTPSLVENLPAGTAGPPEELEWQEMRQRTASFVCSLPDRLVALCALYYAEDDARLKDVASALGFSGPSGLARHQEDFLRRLRAFMSEYADLLEDARNGRDNAQEFLHLVYEMCKKRYAASSSTAGGLNHG